MTTHTQGVCATGLRTIPLVLEPVRHAHWPRRLLTPGQHGIGADPHREICVSVQGMAPTHAILTVDDSGVWIEAEDRRTWVNDGPVRRSRLNLHDRITVGPCSWIVLPATADDILGGWPSSPIAPSASSPKGQPTLQQSAAEPIAQEATSSTRIDDASQDHKPVAAGLITPPAPIIADEAGDPSNDALGELDRASNLLDLIDQTEGVSVSQPALKQVADRPSQKSPLDSSIAAVSKEISGQHELVSPNELIRLHDELQDLRRELDQARAAWRAETHRREVELATESTALARRGAAIERSEHELNRQRQQIESQLQQLDHRESVQSQLSHELERLQSELLSERLKLESLSSSAREELAAESLRRNAEWSEWEQTQERLLADLAQRTTALDEQRALLQIERETLALQRKELEARCREFAESQRAFEESRESWVREHDLWKGRCRAQDRAQTEALIQIERQQTQLAIEVQERSRQQGDYLAAQQQLQAERRQFQELQQAWIQEREQAWQELIERRKRIDAESDSLEQSRQAVEQLQIRLERESQDLQQQREELVTAVPPAPLVGEPELNREQSRLQAEYLAAQKQLQEDRREFLESQQAWNQEREQARQELIERRKGIDADSDSLEQSRQELEQLQIRLERESQDLQQQREELIQATLPEQTVFDEELIAAENTTNSEEENQPPETSADFEAVQEALDVLAARFEEFSELEQRITNKRAELREQQQLHADRQQEFRHEVSQFEQEQAEWRQAQSEHEARCQAWEVARQSEVLAQKAERERWAAHVADLHAWLESPPVATSSEQDDAASSDVEHRHNEHSEDESLTTVETEDLNTPAELMETPESVSTEIPLTTETPEIFSAEETADANEADVPSDAEPPLDVVEDTTLATLNSSDEFDSSTDWTAPDSPAEGNTDPVPAETGEASSSLVRSELAKMFGLPENFAEHPPASGDHDHLSVAQDESTGLGVENLDEGNSSPDAEAHAEEDWRSRLTEVLGELPTKGLSPRAAEPQASAPEPPELPEETANPESESDSESEDSIASYMQRLLARTRGSSEEVEAPPPVPQRIDTTSLTQNFAQAESIETDEKAESPLVTEPRTRLDKETTRAELQSFRHVANMSARAALARHTWRTTSTELSIQLAITTGCAIGSVGYLGAPLWGQAPQWFPGLGCSVGALFLGYRAWQTYSKLRQWSHAYDLASLVSHTESGSEAEVEAEFSASAKDAPPHTPAEDQLSAATGVDTETKLAFHLEPATALETESAVAEEASRVDQAPEATLEPNECEEKSGLD